MSTSTRAIANMLVPRGTCAVAVHSYAGAGDGQTLVWWELRFLLSYSYGASPFAKSSERVADLMGCRDFGMSIQLPLIPLIPA